jgi:hypothetical protein
MLIPKKLFGGSIEARVLSLREQHKDDLDKVVSLVLSHIKAQRKAKLMLASAILEHVKNTGLPVSNSESPLSTLPTTLLHSKVSHRCKFCSKHERS